jgi:flavin reductase (DIM6/NTAB) family NADH-FMN oxidoreductase RutF
VELTQDEPGQRSTLTVDFDFTSLPPEDRYRLLCSFVAPRPIALVSTVDRDGVRNAAPMSFFNVFSQSPPILILGIQNRPDGAIKDTLANLDATGEFVVNMVDMAIAEAMVVCGMNYPPEIDEAAAAGLTWRKSRSVAPDAIDESPCAMECRVTQTIRYPTRAIVLGEVVHMSVRDTCLDAAGRYVRPEAYQPIARLHANNYVVADNQFVLDPPTELPMPRDLR